MDVSVSWAIVGIALLFFAVLSAVLIWLWREHKKLKQQVRILVAQVQRSNDDLIGLCSAAVVVDKRLAANEACLNTMLEDGPAPRQTAMVREDVLADESQDQGYERAIRKIRQGATVDDLVKNCGLTRDEAVLLVRLHGKR